MALDLFKEIPIAPIASVLGALFEDWKIHDNVELPGNHGALALLPNIYAKTGKWGLFLK